MGQFQHRLIHRHDLRGPQRIQSATRSGRESLLGEVALGAGSVQCPLLHVDLPSEAHHGQIGRGHRNRHLPPGILDGQRRNRHAVHLLHTLGPACSRNQRIRDVRRKLPLVLWLHDETVKSAVTVEGGVDGLQTHRRPHRRARLLQQRIRTQHIRRGRLHGLIVARGSGHSINKRHRLRHWQHGVLRDCSGRGRQHSDQRHRCRRPCHPGTCALVAGRPLIDPSGGECANDHIQHRNEND